MIKKSEIEFERYRLIKTARTLIRLKHSLEADKELNDFLPDRLNEFDQMLQEGVLDSKVANQLLEG